MGVAGIASVLELAVLTGRTKRNSSHASRSAPRKSVFMIPHCILFELANFRGAHRHVFVAEPNLAEKSDPTFNDKTSSIVVLEGDWVFFSDSNFGTRTGNVLGPGVYPFVANVGIMNDSITSLRPVRRASR
jgi:hypothetical protein